MYLSYNITAALAFEDPVEQGIKATQVGDSAFLQQQRQGRHLVTGGSAAPHLLQPLGVLAILAPCRNTHLPHSVKSVDDRVSAAPA